MAELERDPHTGYTTTGHEWNGIVELNRPVPRVIWVFLAATVIFSVVYWILMPAWPLVKTYTRGILGADQRSRVVEDIRKAVAGRAVWTRKIRTLGYSEIQADETLMRIVRLTGRPLFEDNCGACHGMRGQGANGFPRLTDRSWLWGGDAKAVAETVRVGINSTHEETRVSQMQGFGRDGVLDRQAIFDVVAYLRSLSRTRPANNVRPGSVAAGAKIYAANCVACHGKDATGNIKLGAPDLTDDYWIYGGDLQSVYTTIDQGRKGHMPHWEGRLSELERKILVLFVLDLGRAIK